MTDDGRWKLWTPKHPGDKPPGNPFQKQTQNAPPAPPPKTSDESERPVPCPPEVKAMMEEFFKKFAMDRERRDARMGRTRNTGKAKTHMERLAESDPADETWFYLNQHKVNQILRERKKYE